MKKITTFSNYHKSNNKAILTILAVMIFQTISFSQYYSYEVNTSGITDRLYILLKSNNSTGFIPQGNNDIEINVKGKRVTLNGLYGTAGVRMYDVVGKLMYQYPKLENNQSFDVNVPGIYFMDIKTDNQTVKVKIHIQND